MLARFILGLMPGASVAKLTSLVFMASVADAGVVTAPRGVEAEDFSPEPGFVMLFNGRDLDGWKYGNDTLTGKTETADGRFGVEGAAIVAREGKGIKVLNTVAEFPGSFVLKMEFRASEKSDSGVYVRGPQLQVRDFIRRGEQKALEKVFRNDDWNELEITVREGVISCDVNGKALAKTDVLEVAVRDGQPTVVLNGQPVALGTVELRRAAVAECKLNGEVFDRGYKPGPKGGIGLQAETGKFEFRRVRIKELP